MNDNIVDENSIDNPMSFAPNSQSMPLVESDSHLQSDSFYRPLTEEVSPMVELYKLLNTVDIKEADLKKTDTSQDTLLKLYQQETGYLSGLKWCSVDHSLEKILQYLFLSQHDLNLESKTSNPWKRVWPAERSILLKSTWGLIKAYGVQGFVRGLELGLFTSIHVFIYSMLLYRLVKLIQSGSTSIDELCSSFIGSDQKGIDSLVHVLAKLGSQWLKLILTSPFIIGGLQSISSMVGARRISSDKLKNYLQNINVHLQSSGWLRNGIYESLPGISTASSLSLSGKLQKLDSLVRWDGRISSTQRRQIFDVMCRVALEGKKTTQLNALQSLAKIAHGVGLRDLLRLKEAGYSKEEIIAILSTKSKALEMLESLPRESNRESQSSRWQTIQSLPQRVYRQYLLWWLGGLKTHIFKQQLPASLLKGMKLTIELYFFQMIVLSILEAIRCPDKPGFQLGFGYTIEANKFTKECYSQLVDNFRTVNSSDPVNNLIQQTQKFDLRTLDNLTLWFKNLTGQEMVTILQSAEGQGARFKNIYIYQDITDPDMKDLAGYLKNSTTIEGIELGCDDSVIGGGETVTNQGFKYLTQVLPFMQQFTYLRFCFPNVNDTGIEYLVNIVNQTKINNFNIHADMGDEAGVKFVRVLATMPIQQLDLSCYPMGDATIKELAAVVKNNPGLIQLRVDANLMTNDGAILLAEMVTNSSLQIFGARGTGITDEGLIAIANALPTMPLLTNLAIGSRSGDSGILAIINQLNKTNLNWFEFWFNSLSVLSMQTFATVLPSTSIQQLAFGHNNLNDSAIVSILAQGIFESSVTQLSIWSNDLSESLPALCPALSHLDLLQIEQGNLTDEGLIKLASALRSSPVTQLGFSVNHISDEGFNALTAILPYTNISYIDLQQNDITDQSAQTFADVYPCTQVRSVYLMDNLISSNILYTVENFQLINYCQEQLCHTDAQYNGHCGSFNQSLNLMNFLPKTSTYVSYMGAKAGFLAILIQSISAKGITMAGGSLLCAYAALKISRSAVNFFMQTKNNCSNIKTGIKLPKYSSFFYRKPTKTKRSNCLENALHRLGTF